MMTSPVWCELVCGECGCTTAGRFTYNTIPRVQMRAEAKKAGWILRASEWYCSNACWAASIETRRAFTDKVVAALREHAEKRAP